MARRGVEVVKVEGLAELKDALRQLPDATAKNVMRRVLRKNLQPIADAAEANAPKRTGDLGRRIQVSSKLYKRQRGQTQKEGPDDVEIYAGPGPGHAKAITQEFGSFKEPAQPYMRPAWDTGKGALLEGIKVDMWEEISKSAERLARKTARLKASG